MKVRKEESKRRVQNKERPTWVFGDGRWALSAAAVSVSAIPSAITENAPWPKYAGLERLAPFLQALTSRFYPQVYPRPGVGDLLPALINCLAIPPAWTSLIAAIIRAHSRNAAFAGTHRGTQHCKTRHGLHPRNTLHRHRICPQYCLPRPCRTLFLPPALSTSLTRSR